MFLNQRCFREKKNAIVEIHDCITAVCLSLLFMVSMVWNMLTKLILKITAQPDNSSFCLKEKNKAGTTTDPVMLTPIPTQTKEGFFTSVQPETRISMVPAI